MIIAMKQWLSGSLTYSAFHKLFVLLRTALKKIGSAAARLCRGSVLEKLYNGSITFLEKEPHIRQSLFYKALTWFGGKLKKAAAVLNGFFRLQFEHSLFWKIIKDTDNEFHANPYVLSGLVFAGAFVSYSAAIVLRGTVGTKSLVIAAVLFVTSVVLLFVKDKIKNIICGSLLYKLIVLAVKAVLP